MKMFFSPRPVAHRPECIKGSNIIILISVLQDREIEGEVVVEGSNEGPF
jgi:hypothetical protein